MITSPVELDLSTGPLLLPVLRRVVGAIAAQAGLALDEIGDLTLVTETLAATAPRLSPDGRMRLTVAPEPGRVTLAVGPFADGGVAELRRASLLPDVGPVLERLAREVRGGKAGDGEFLTVVVGRNGTPV